MSKFAPKLNYSDKTKFLTRRHSSFNMEAFRAARNLTAFQKEKLTWYFFAFFDTKRQGSINEDSIKELTERMRTFAGWAETSEDFLALQDLHNNFFDCMIDQTVLEARDMDVHFPNDNTVSLGQWLNMWGRMIPGATSMMSFPFWCQILPNMIFNVMDRDKDNQINREELKLFYRDFTGVPDDLLDAVAEEGYNAMTGNGDFPLTKELYQMNFANFLLGRSSYGPGKYVFGVFNKDELGKKFKVNLTVPEDD